MYSNVNSRNVLLRPVLPENLGNELFLFDFSLAQPYRDPKTFAHTSFCSGLSVTYPPPGTFSSINFHLGNRLSRRDDLESLSYLLVYLLRGSLPWLDSGAMSNSGLLQQKQDISIAELCNNLPSCFADFIHYARELSFTQKPDYSFLRSIFHNLGDATTPSTTTSFFPANVERSEQVYWTERIASVVPVPKTPRKRIHDQVSLHEHLVPSTVKRYVLLLPCIINGLFESLRSRRLARNKFTRGSPVRHLSHM